MIADIVKLIKKSFNKLKISSKYKPISRHASARHLAPQDRFWDSMSQKSIRHEANLLGSSHPASATDYAQKTLRQGYHKWLYGSSG
jgi:hypothetical protein